MIKRPRVLIADDHKMFTQGLRSLLEDEVELVGTVADGQALLDETIRLQPDLVLVDISMPVLNGLDAANRLRKDHSNVKIIFLTMHADGRLLSEAFRAGASGYVLKQSAGEELILAIRQVLAGNNYITPLIAREWLKEPAEEADKQPLNLTPRQREVLKLVIAGCTMKEAAAQLGISTRTAESHKYEMMEALGVANTAELIRYAIKLGLTES
jgi:DNA-binding NarL/FixJ family response regulator